MNKVLVTGSSGFIGTNLMAALGDRGVPFDLKTGQDVMSRYGVDAAMSGIGAVVHLAAHTGVGQSIQQPILSLENVLQVGTLLEACRRTGAAFYLASTAGALSGQPRSPYAASKLAGEAYCSAYAWSFGARTAALRFGNVYGPWSAHKRTAIPALCKSLLERIPFELYGDGRQRRDFIFVGDLCAGIIAAVDAEVEGQFCLASGQQTRLDVVIDLMAEIAGREIGVSYKPQRPGEAETSPIDISLSQMEFGFNPSTTLEDGLRQTWQWFSDAATTRSLKL